MTASTSGVTATNALADDPHVAYWDEAISNTFEEAGACEAFKSLTVEQRIQIAKDLRTSAECESMAFGPVPSGAEIQSWEDSDKAKSMQYKLDQAAAREEAYRKQIGRDHRIDPRRIYVNDGRVEADR